MGIRKLIIIVSSTVIQFFAFSKLLTRVQIHKSDSSVLLLLPSRCTQ